MSRRFISDNVEVRLDEGLESFVEDILQRTEAGAIRALRREMGEIAQKAEREWYCPDGVTRRTGQSGRISVQERVDLSRGDITFSVGSTDRRTVRGKPVAAFVRRPARTSTVLKVVTPREYFAAPEAMRGPWLPGPPKRPQLFIPNPKASDGRKLLDVFIRAPVRKASRKLARSISEEIRNG